MRLIDADVAQRIADKELYLDEAGAVQFVLSHCPTIEAELVKHGRWENCFEQDGEKAGYCSECHAIRFVDPYCPNCGAKMDGDSHGG